MISDTLADRVAEYGIGQKIRAMRSAKKLGLAQLGEHSGLSPGMLSKIERGQIVPTLPTLLRIAMVFGVGLDHFFVESEAGPGVSVVRRSERMQLPDRPGSERPSYLFESLDFTATDRAMNAFLAVFPAGSGPSEPHSHPGAEFLYVVAGSLALTVDATEVPLGEGDSAYIHPEVSHSYRQRGAAPCSALVVVAV